MLDRVAGADDTMTRARYRAVLGVERRPEARADSLTPEERSEIASKAAAARWNPEGVYLSRQRKEPDDDRPRPHLPIWVSPPRLTRILRFPHPYPCHSAGARTVGPPAEYNSPLNGRE